MTDVRDALAEVILAEHEPGFANVQSSKARDALLTQFREVADAILAEFIVVPIGDAKPSIQPWLDAERLTYEAVVGRDAATEPASDLHLDADAATDLERSDRTLHDAMGRCSVEDAIARWEKSGPTSLTVALMADALYGVREATS